MSQARRREVALSILLCLLATFPLACRSSGTATETALTPGKPLASIQALRGSLRVRATNGERTQSFRAQLLVEPARSRMLLTAYTPVGTTAMVLFAEGTAITVVDHLNRTAWRGTAVELSDSLGLFGSALPADWALAALGYPADLGDTSIVYEPAGVVPATMVRLSRGSQLVEITNLERFETDASPKPPAVPGDYRCCVAPRL